MIIFLREQQRHRGLLVTVIIWVGDRFLAGLLDVVPDCGHTEDAVLIARLGEVAVSVTGGLGEVGVRLALLPGGLAGDALADVPGVEPLGSSAEHDVPLLEERVHLRQVFRRTQWIILVVPKVLLFLLHDGGFGKLI